ncbi:MAG: SAM-dependent chlorinase/fluorinase [marine benthic group bacterium]|nr:SAM-dependent chlorinase/fluorinase [Candidatus Benthicola marisminoris]
MSIVTLITDFGTRDGYVGEMKGEILARCPDATLVDVTHDVEPGDIQGASWVLNRVWSRFPEGTVHLGVVDPGVGGARRAVAVERADRWFVGPDNGLISAAVDGLPSQARIIDPDSLGLAPASVTFHGRDVFAPAGAWLAGGGAPARVGEAIDPGSLVRLELPGPERLGAAVRGQVAHIDRFGNLVTDIPAAWVSPTALIEISGEEVSGLRTHYGAAEDGELLALIGSGGMLEISVRNGSAAARLSAHRGAVVRVRTHRD